MTAAEAPLPAIRAVADRAFSPERGMVVYADRVPRGPGSVQVGDESITVPAPSVLVFRDEQPGANWMHSCSYALVDLADGTVVLRVRADRPPVFGLLPSSWIVVSDPDRLADLLRPPDPAEEASP